MYFGRTGMVTGGEWQLHNHDSAKRDPTFVKCLGNRDIAMRVGLHILV